MPFLCTYFEKTGKILMALIKAVAAFGACYVG